MSGLLALLAAVTAYYGVIALAGTRPSAGVHDLLREGVIWGAAALVGGPVAGVVGWFARHGGRWSRPLAWGGLGGLLASQGVYSAVSWWQTPYDMDVWSVGLLAGLILVPAAVVLWFTRRTRPHVALAALLVVAAGGAGGWFLVYEIVYSQYR